MDMQEVFIKIEKDSDIGKAMSCNDESIKELVKVTNENERLIISQKEDDDFIYCSVRYTVDEIVFRDKGIQFSTKREFDEQ